MGENKSAYYAALAAQQDAARKFVETSLRSYYRLDPDIGSQDFKDFAVEILGQAFRVYGDQAAVVACQEYDSTMRALGFDVAPADIVNDFVSSASVESAVGYFRSRAVAGNLDFDGFVAAMTAKANDHALRAANKTMVANAERSRDRRAGVRYARVPSGRETCGFCLMLASRGFVYATKATAGDIGRLYNYYHDHCDCTVVPGALGTEIDGYDPIWYYEVYRDARETAGVTNSTKELNKVVNEINRRKREWAWSGEDGKTTIEGGAKPKQKELEAADLINLHGFDVNFVKPANVAGRRTADCIINNRYWEIKRPQGNADEQTIGKSTIDHQFESAIGQSRRLILDVTLIEDYQDVTTDFARDEASRLFYGKYSAQFDELVVLDKTRMRRYLK